MVTVAKHPFVADPKQGTPLCMTCKMPQRHPAHKQKETMVKGTATPTKTG